MLTTSTDSALALLMRAYKVKTLLTSRLTLSHYKHVAHTVDVDVQFIDEAGSSVHFGSKSTSSVLIDVQAALCDDKIAVRATDPILVVLGNPDSLVGRLLDSQGVFDLAREWPTVTFVLDESLIDYWAWTEPEGEEYFEKLTIALQCVNNVFVLRSFAYAFGLAGAGIAYMMGNPASIPELAAMTTDTISTLSMVAAASVLENRGYYKVCAREMRKEQRRVEVGLHEDDFVVAHGSKANFLLAKPIIDSLTTSLADDDELEWRKNVSVLTRKMRARGVWIRDVSKYLENHVRITIGTPHDNSAMLADIWTTMVRPMYCITSAADDDETTRVAEEFERVQLHEVVFLRESAEAARDPGMHWQSHVACVRKIAESEAAWGVVFESDVEFTVGPERLSQVFDEIDYVMRHKCADIVRLAARVEAIDEPAETNTCANCPSIWHAVSKTSTAYAISACCARALLRQPDFESPTCKSWHVIPYVDWYYASFNMLLKPESESTFTMIDYVVLPLVARSRKESISHWLTNFITYSVGYLPTTVQPWLNPLPCFHRLSESFYNRLGQW